MIDSHFVFVCLFSVHFVLFSSVNFPFVFLSLSLVSFFVRLFCFYHRVILGSLWDDKDVTEEENVEAKTSLTLPYSAAIRPSKLSQSPVGNSFMSEFNKFIELSSPPNDDGNGDDVRTHKAKKSHTKTPRTAPYVHKSTTIDLQIQIKDPANDTTNSRYQTKTNDMCNNDAAKTATIVSRKLAFDGTARSPLADDASPTRPMHAQQRANNVRTVTDTPKNRSTHTNTTQVQQSQPRNSQNNYSTTITSKSSTSHPYRLPIIDYTDKETSSTGLDQSHSTSISNKSNSSVGCDPSNWRTKDALISK